MIGDVLGILAVGYILLQIAEHVIFPLVWSFLQRKKGSMSDLSSMIGKAGLVKEWNGLNGKIFIEGGIWSATGKRQFNTGDKVVIESIEGLKMIVSEAIQVEKK